tara:strand:+ start:493 stop:726 length:234 start_codon:yes stop_codon:yes gene_type:complete
MALTTEQQAQVDVANATENTRHANYMQVENVRLKMDAVRVAKEVLTENARSQPVEDRQLTSSDITDFARVLLTYVNL